MHGADAREAEGLGLAAYTLIQATFLSINQSIKSNHH
jgi:hypothetical protein